MRAYDPRIYPWARCRRDRQKMAGKPIYTIDAIAECRGVRALIRNLAGLAGEASRCPLYPRKRTLSDATGISALCHLLPYAAQQKRVIRLPCRLGRGDAGGKRDTRFCRDRILDT